MTSKFVYPPTLKLYQTESPKLNLKRVFEIPSEESHLEDVGGNVLEDRDQVDGDLLVVAAVLQDLKQVSVQSQTEHEEEEEKEKI